MTGKRPTNRELLEGFNEILLQLVKDKQDFVEDKDTFTANQNRTIKLLTNLTGEVSEIKNRIYDNPRTGEKGIISTQNEQEGRIQNLETKNKVTAGKVAFAAFLIVTLGGFFISVLTFFENIFGN